MRVAVGKILKPHGIKGELKVLPETFDVERFHDLENVLLESSGQNRHYKVESVRVTTDGKVFLRLEGIEDRNAADLLRNSIISISSEESVELPVDTYFHYDLVGMTVFDRFSGKELGVLKEIIDASADDLYVVRGLDKEYLIPARKEFIKLVDVDNKRMEIESIPGLLDL